MWKDFQKYKKQTHSAHLEFYLWISKKLEFSKIFSFWKFSFQQTDLNDILTSLARVETHFRGVVFSEKLSRNFGKKNMPPIFKVHNNLQKSCQILHGVNMLANYISKTRTLFEYLKYSSGKYLVRHYYLDWPRNLSWWKYVESSQQQITLKFNYVNTEICTRSIRL